MAGRVEVSAASLLRAWRESEHTEFWVQFTTDHPDAEAFDRAIVDPDESTWQDGIIPRTTGRIPKGFVALVEGATDKNDLLNWANSVAHRLENQGASGTLSGAKEAELPRWFTAEPGEPTAFMTWSYGAAELSDNPQFTRPAWKPDDSTTRAISEVCARFTAPGGDRIILRQGAFQLTVSDHDDIVELLTNAIASDGLQAGVSCANNGTKSARWACLRGNAETVLQCHGSKDWAARVDALTDAITERADLLDHAFIRPAYQLAHSWVDVDYWHPIPHTDNSVFGHNQHLTGSHVIDAHGVQVLTDTHLGRIRDLSRWNVRDLGHSRHLVTALDLEPWYSPPTPEPHVLEQARSDFAAILLTPEAIEINPPPWS